jgi:pimeloyl-ACP methyl ester carboxylesterase
MTNQTIPTNDAASDFCKTAGFKEGFFDIGGVKLHYVEAGTGPLIIFYHGFPLFWFSFHHQMSALKDRYRVVAVDGLGINLSAKPDDLAQYKLPNLAHQLDQLAKHLIGDERFYLVGHDWGGALAWSFAQYYPHRLHRVVGINAPPTNQLLALLENNPDQQTRSAYMYSMRSGQMHKRITENGANLLWQNTYANLRKLPHFTAEHDEVFRQGLAQPGAVDGAINWYRANIPQLDQINEDDFWPSRTASTSVPGLLIWGEKDDTFVSSFIDDLSRYVEDLQVCRLPGIGHSPMLEDPHKTNEILREFFRN